MELLSAAGRPPPASSHCVTFCDSSLHHPPPVTEAGGRRRRRLVSGRDGRGFPPRTSGDGRSSWLGAEGSPAPRPLRSSRLVSAGFGSSASLLLRLGELPPVSTSPSSHPPFTLPPVDPLIVWSASVISSFCRCTACVGAEAEVR